MVLLLCSRNDTVLEKWRPALNKKWQTSQAKSLTELFSKIDGEKIDIILLHRSMIDAEQLRQVCSLRNAGLKIFVFSDRPDDNEGTFCLQLGCVGYANTYIRADTLVAAIETILSGRVWVGSSLMQYIIRSMATTPQAEQREPGQQLSNPLLAQLSKRELQIATLVADGLHNNEIAEELEITERTVKAHLSSIYAKTNTKGRLNLALLINGNP